MKKMLLFLSVITLSFAVKITAQETNISKPEVMILGVFHFAYPNNDRTKIEKKDQIDFRSGERKREIEELVTLLEKYKPTKIAVEIKTWSQRHTDSLYQEYLKGNFDLPINESYQLGFKLAKILNLPKVYCIDAWGNISGYFTGDNKTVFNLRKEKENLLTEYEKYTDSLLALKRNEPQKDNGKGESGYKSITEILSGLNSPGNLALDNAKYLNELSSFEEKEYDYAGADWISASWIDRNLRIFRNIRRITESNEDRILVIFGAGHAFLLNDFLKGSLKYNVVPVLNYIKN